MLADLTPEQVQALLKDYVRKALEDWETHKASISGPFHSGFPEGHAEVLRTLEP